MYVNMVNEKEYLNPSCVNSRTASIYLLADQIIDIGYEIGVSRFANVCLKSNKYPDMNNFHPLEFVAHCSELQLQVKIVTKKKSIISSVLTFRALN